MKKKIQINNNKRFMKQKYRKVVMLNKIRKNKQNIS